MGGSDRLCPTPPGRLTGMKTHYAAEETVETLITTFGTGRLVRRGNGRFELRGGTHRDLVDAREWASLFMSKVKSWAYHMDPRQQWLIPERGQPEWRGWKRVWMSGL